MKQKTIIANWGSSGQGKSETIRLVTNDLVSNHNATVTNFIKPIFLANGDIKLVLSFNNILIGIESQGDPNSRLFQSIPDFIKVKCDIILCATRTNGATVNLISNTANSNNYRLIWITNYRTNSINYNTLNNFSANHLTQLILNIENDSI